MDRDETLRLMAEVGPRRAIASEQEERILAERRVALARTWDTRPCPEGGLDDLALDLFLVGYRQFAVASEVIEQNHRELTDQLAALRFYDLRTSRPTHAAIVLFGSVIKGTLGVGLPLVAVPMLLVAVEGRTWQVQQILGDPAGDHDWRITAEVDLDASDEAADLVLRVTGLVQL